MFQRKKLDHIDLSNFSFPLDLNFPGTIILCCENVQVFITVEIIWKSLFICTGGLGIGKVSFAFQEGDKDRIWGAGFCIFVFAMNFD